MADIESNIRFGVDTSDAIASIKMLQAQISAFQKQMASSSVANAESARKLRRGLIDDLNATGQWSASIKTIKSTSDSFTNALEKNKLSMGEYFRYGASQVGNFRNIFSKEFNTIEKVARERVKDLQTQYIALGRDANGALKSIAVRPLKLDMESLATQTAINAQRQQIFNQLLKQGSTNLLNFGKNTQWAGRQLMVGFTIPLSIFGTQASRTFMQLEEQAIRFKRVYGELFTPPEEADEMLETLKELGKEFTRYGVAVEKTLGLAADAAAMGKQGTDLLDQVTEANRLAVLGNVDQQQALETTISLTNAFGIATEDLAKKIDFLNAVENQTVVSIEDLTIAIPKAGPVVQQLGGDVEDLAFFLTAMKEGGINASEGANALKSGLASLINPTDQAANMLKVFGINVRDIVAQSRGDVKKLVLDFASALDTLDPSQRAQAIEQLFGKFQFSRLSTLFQNVIQEGTQASRVLELTNATTQELAQLSSKELKRVEESTTFRFRKAIEEFQLAIAPVGEEFLKLITPIIEFATKIIEQFNSLSKEAKGFITGLVVLLGAVGPVALMTFGLLANGLANIIKSFTFLRDLFQRTGKQSSVLGEQFDYLTTEQLQASAVAASLDQVHQQLIQTFSSEASAVKRLGDIYKQAFNEQQRFDTGRAIAQRAGLRLASGIISVPGPKGAGDVVPAMLSPGEAVIPAEKAKKYAPLIQGMIAGNIPGFAKGVFLGMPRSGKGTQKDREAAEQVYASFQKSSYANVPPREYGHQLAKTTGHSFPIFGLGGVYMSPEGKRVFVKPVLDERAALAEMRSTEITRKAHGLKAPAQKIVVMRDPTDIKRQRKFLALESELDATFMNNDPMAVFNEDQYFKQLVASLLRVDKDLSASNVYKDVVADVGAAGVFTRASGPRDYAEKLPSMEEQAMINLLGIKGGAKRAFAESTVSLMAGLTPQQYHQRMITEIQQVLPLLKQTIAGFGLTDPREVKAYADMVSRLEQGLTVDWSKFHAIHSRVKQAKPKQTIPGYAEGVVSVPGPKGKGDVVPAMLSPGEAVIPAEEAKQYSGLIQAIMTGKVPGYKRGLFTSKNKDVQFGQSDLYSASASHFDIFARSGGMAQTLEELKDELDGIVADVVIVGEKLEDGTHSIERVTQNLADIETATTDKSGNIVNRDMAVAGKTYRGTTILESKSRNTAYEQKISKSGEKVAQGAPFTLESVAVLGQRAAQALAYNAEMNENVADELRQMVVEGQEATRLLNSSNSVQERLNYMYDNTLEALTQSYLANTGITDAEEARRLATENLTRVQNEVANLQRNGVDEEQLLQEAKKKLAASMVRSGAIEGQTLEIISGAPGTAGGILPDIATGRMRSGTVSAEDRPRTRVAAMRSTAQVASAEFNILNEAGGEIVDNALSAITAGARRRLDINSPSRETFMVGEQGGQGLIDGAMSTIDDAAAAGQAIGQAMAGKRGTRRASTNPETVAWLAQQQSQAGAEAPVATKRGPRRVTVPGTKEQREAAEAAQSQSSMLVTEANNRSAAAITENTDRLAKMNSLFMSTTFAISSLSGVLSLFGGQFAELNQQIFGISTAMFALMQITQLLTQTKIAELFQTRALNAGLAIQNIQTKKLMLNSSLFSGGLLNLGKAVLRFLGPIGLAITLFTALTGIVSIFNQQQEEQRRKIEGLGDTAYMTSEKMKKAAELLGFTAKTVSFSERLGAGTAAGRDAEEASKISTLRESEEFKTKFAAEIQAIKDATVADAETALASVAAQLAAAGADQDTVDAYVRAIAQEAGRTDLNLSFAKIDFTKEGVSQIIDNAKSAADSFGRAFTDGVTATVKKYTAATNPFEFVFQGTRVENVAVDPTSITDQQLKTGEATMNISDEFKKSAELFAGVQAASLQSLADGLQNGLIGATEFNQGLVAVVSELEGLNEVSAGLVLPSLYEKLGIAETMEGIPNVQDQLLLLQAIAGGYTPSEAEKNALKNANKNAEAARTATRVRSKLTNQIKNQAIEQENLNNKQQEEALINEQIGSATAALNDRVVALQNQSAAYQFLIEQGYSAEVAFDMAGDAGLAAGIKAAMGAGVASQEWKDLKALLDQVISLEKKAPKGPSSAGEKSKYQQTIESLQEQRAEIRNNSIAVARLIDQGFDLASAMRAAEDPITAAAIATTKVGDEKWNRLIKAIRTTQALLSKKEIQELLRGGKIEKADMQSKIAVSTALGRLGWTAEQIDEALSDQTFTNTLAKDLQDGVINSQDLLNRLTQIKQLEDLQVQLNFTTKEGTAEEFQKRYDKVVGYLEAKKQTIEVNFQVKTEKDNIIARKAEEAIAAIQYTVDDFEAELTGIEDQEEKINEQYDKRKEALDAVIKANSSIQKQQKAQLTLADALTQGDIAAAARAAQELRAQRSDESLQKQGEFLDQSREIALGRIRSVNGRSRQQIEDEIKKLKQQIFDIEEKTLEPARERIRLAEVEKNAALDSINSQILRWEVLAARVNEAKLKLTPEEMAAMEYQAGLIADLLENWDKIEDKTAILTIIKKTLGLEDGATSTKDTGTKDTGTKDTGTGGTTTTTSSSSTTTKAVITQMPVAKAAEILNAKTALNNAAAGAEAAKASATLAKAAGVVVGKTTADTAERKIVNAVASASKTVAGRTADSIERAIVAAKPAAPVINQRLMKASGGMIKRYATGGFAMGTDIVPAMLTPGEFVVRKHAVQSFGVDRLKAINNGKYNGDSVYNYEVNVNVKSDANPDQIARAVMTQIKQIDSQRIRSTRL